MQADIATLKAAHRGLGLPGDHHHVSPVHPEYAPGIAQKHDVAKAKALLAEAGYPNGIDAGDFVPIPGFPTVAESVVNDLVAAGIRVRMRATERAAFYADWKDKKLRGLFMVAVGNSGNATGPHLHFHVAIAPGLEGEGLPYAFDAFTAVGTETGPPDEGAWHGERETPRPVHDEMPLEHQLVRFAGEEV